MPNTSSSRTFPVMSSSVTTRERTFLSQFVMSMAIVILLVGFCPYVSSSPTPSSIDHDNKMNYDSNGLTLNANDYQTAGDSPSLLSPVQQSLSESYIQPRAHANQFLMSNTDDNQVTVSKRFTRFNSNNPTNNNDDDLSDYLPYGMLATKRSSPGNIGRFSNFNKRKQGTKPPMEVMNEIVNSIYLKR
ncbi:unnamed protein product [Adineta steineri]|uniref:Uncharacterized protein n=1 Tax=Adineta steineri TaxID=433720 RepID=A0A813WBL1_9BILA|nr:unnamed protein product [Adineta steineri]CAF0946584.1 unnamed protein product [Adineta steineri]